MSRVPDTAIATVKSVRRAIEFCGKHPFATGLFALLSLTGLGVSVTGYRVDREEAALTTGQIQRVEEKIDLIRTHDKADKPTFQGSWNEAAAFSTAWPQPRHMNTDPGWNDRLERSFFLSLQGNDVRVLLTSYSEGDCNACQVVLSAFVFVKDGPAWYLTSEARDFTTIGRAQFNSMDESLRVFDIGSGRFGIRFNVMGWHQGNTYESVSIYTFVAEELIKIAGGVVRVYFSGVEQEEAEQLGLWEEDRVDVSFDPNEASFGLYDIIATYATERNTTTRTERYEFDGNRYDVLLLDDLQECGIDLEAYILGESCALSGRD